MPSFGFALFRLLIKIKGIKAIFSVDPIPYLKLRKDDVYTAPKLLKKNNLLRRFELANTQITEIKALKAAKKEYLLIYCPGGAFVSGPSLIAWLNVKLVVSKTKCTTWMVNYPKAPENNIVAINQSIDAVYQKALNHYKTTNIILMGDSAGGNLILSLVQRLLKKGAAIPRQLIAISPLVDCTVGQTESLRLDPKDLMLSRKGVLSANKMCAGPLSLNDARISPLYGSFEGFPAIQVFLAEQDILSPGIVEMLDKMQAAGTKVHLIKGKSMPHIWPMLYFFKEAQMGLEQIISTINSVTEGRLS